MTTRGTSRPMRRGMWRASRTGWNTQVIDGWALGIGGAAVEGLIKPMNRGRKSTEPFRKEGDRDPVAGASG
jgi:hypothetical protein